MLASLDERAHSAKLGRQAAAKSAHREVDPQPERLTLCEFTIHLLTAQIECAAAAQPEHLKDRAHHGLHHPVGDGRRWKVCSGFHGWIPFS